MSDDDCVICTETVKDEDEALCCDACEKWSHRECLKISKTSYKKLEKSNKSWKCDKCKRSNNSTKDISNGDSKLPNQKDNYTIGDIMEKLLEMEHKYNKIFEKYEEQLNINDNLRKELQSIKRQLNNKEQEALNNNLIVQGIPFKENENVQAIVERIATTLKVPNRVQKSFRLGSAKNGKTQVPIKIIFSTPEEKKCWMVAKKNINLTTATIMAQGSATEPIFLNHELTRQNIELYMKAREFKKDNEYKYLWISHGKILLRKSDMSKIKLIESEADLKN